MHGSPVPGTLHPTPEGGFGMQASQPVIHFLPLLCIHLSLQLAFWEILYILSLKGPERGILSVLFLFMLSL